MLLCLAKLPEDNLDIIHTWIMISDAPDPKTNKSRGALRQSFCGNRHEVIAVNLPSHQNSGHSNIGSYIDIIPPERR